MAALHRLDVITSLLSTLLGLGRGMMAQPLAVHAPPPAQRLRLYDMEGCPFCRAAREALSALHLDAEIFPCPKGGTRFRPEVVTLGGKAHPKPSSRISFALMAAARCRCTIAAR